MYVIVVGLEILVTKVFTLLDVLYFKNRVKSRAIFPCFALYRKFNEVYIVLYIARITFSEYPCTTSPCKNGGVCKENDDRTDYTCTCPNEDSIHAFTGKNCETR